MRDSVTYDRPRGAKQFLDVFADADIQASVAWNLLDPGCEVTTTYTSEPGTLRPWRPLGTSGLTDNEASGMNATQTGSSSPKPQQTRH